MNFQVHREHNFEASFSWLIYMYMTVDQIKYRFIADLN